MKITDYFYLELRSVFNKDNFSLFLASLFPLFLLFFFSHFSYISNEFNIIILSSLSNSSIEFFSFWGYDGLSLFFIVLTNLIMPLCIVHVESNNYDFLNKTSYSIAIFSVGMLLNCVFLILDIFIFYILFEAILFPFFFYLGISGYRKRRIHAAYLFFFYTLFGSFFMLLGTISIYIFSGTTNIHQLFYYSNSFTNHQLIWFAFFLSFAIKVPLFPFHIWLPEAHVEAPTEGSVILAAILLKLGTYGFLRFLFPIFPETSMYFSPLVLMLATLGVFFPSLSTIRQLDIKKIIAYSSVAHMNYCMLGLFSFNSVSIVGSIYLMIGHGIVSSGLFFCVGFLYKRCHTKIIKYYGGLVQTMPIFSTFFFLFILGNMSMPLTSNFIGEFLILVGLYEENHYISMFFAGIGIFSCSIYSLWLYNKMCFLMPKKQFLVSFIDLNIIEIIILLILVFMMFFLGIFSKPFITLISSSVNYHFFHIL